MLCLLRTFALFHKHLFDVNKRGLCVFAIDGGKPLLNGSDVVTILDLIEGATAYV